MGGYDWNPWVAIDRNTHVFLAYLFFEFFVVNYRPVLIEGVLEASYPSSTTMLMMCIMPTAIMQFHHLISSKRLRNIVNAFCGIYASFMVIGRVLSGVHWFTDIVGGILLSATLVMLYYSTNQLVNSKASRSSQRSRWTGCARRWQPRLSLLVGSQGATAGSAAAPHYHQRKGDFPWPRKNTKNISSTPITPIAG